MSDSKRAAYYAKGMEIWKSPVSTENGDGSTSISIGFQCATATEIVGEEGAQAIAEMLTLTADSESLTAEAAEAAARITELEAALAASQEEVKRLREAIAGALESLDGEPEYHDQGMGCGLEDRGITDRYEAMYHGWEKAMERVYGENVAWAKDQLSAALKGEGK